MKVTETLVKNRIKDILKIYSRYISIYTLCPMTMGYGESGHPDRLLLVNGRLIGIEAKKDKNNHHCRPELKPKSNEVMQKRQAEKIIAAGGDWVCIHSANLFELRLLLDKYSQVKSTEFSDTDKQLLAVIERING